MCEVAFRNYGCIKLQLLAIVSFLNTKRLVATQKYVNIYRVFISGFICCTLIFCLHRITSWHKNISRRSLRFVLLITETNTIIYELILYLRMYFNTKGNNR